VIKIILSTFCGMVAGGPMSNAAAPTFWRLIVVVRSPPLYREVGRNGKTDFPRCLTIWLSLNFLEVIFSASKQKYLTKIWLLYKLKLIINKVVSIFVNNNSRTKINYNYHTVRDERCAGYSPPTWSIFGQIWKYAGTQFVNLGWDFW